MGMLGGNSQSDSVLRETVNHFHINACLFWSTNILYYLALFKTGEYLCVTTAKNCDMIFSDRIYTFSLKLCHMGDMES